MSHRTDWLRWYQRRPSSSKTKHCEHNNSSFYLDQTTHTGYYQCWDCGHGWRSYSRYAWWPIKIKTASLWNHNAMLIVTPGRKWYSHHGFQIGWDGVEQRIYGHTYRFGRLLIIFGSVDKKNIAEHIQAPPSSGKEG